MEEQQSLGEKLGEIKFHRFPCEQMDRDGITAERVENKHTVGTLRRACKRHSRIANMNGCPRRTVSHECEQVRVAGNPLDQRIDLVKIEGLPGLAVAGKRSRTQTDDGDRLVEARSGECVKNLSGRPGRVEIRKRLQPLRRIEALRAVQCGAVKNEMKFVAGIAHRPIDAEKTSLREQHLSEGAGIAGGREQNRGNAKREARPPASEA
jgi:hypothetical protein